jgi:hypothetical protein
MAIKVQGTTVIDDDRAATFVDLSVIGNGAIKIPAGDIDQRPDDSTVGQLRFNTETGAFEGYNGTQWGALATGTGGGGGGFSGEQIASVYTPGQLITGVSQYTARWYPINPITISKTTAFVLTAGSESAEISIRVNNSTVLTLGIDGTTPVANLTEINTSEGDSITVVVEQNGLYAKDLYVSFNYVVTA